MTEPLFFDGWEPLVRITVVGVSMYVTLVLFLRLSGSRTLSTMNAFDFIVTVAIGSVFGRALTAKAVSLTEAVVAFALLIALQFVVTKLQVRWPVFGRAVTNPPTLLYFRGQFLRPAMREQRVTESELQTAARKKDHSSLDEVEAVVLEASGEFSVVASVENPETFGANLDENILDEEFFDDS
ncbi:DUF421 domain-containing protein [Halobacterium jilantaiense]|uniref:DUF421 domain-containing protein n=1 Tax=Halobacterium jilantaiense TaxID=355548 RepID=A0A1I0MLL3_9EURY|nr:YetF domain-containing protein [Halobacterium jilantaiense]SEV88773.1 Protein of unknown function [Halobacterium jilantaiense]